MTLTTPAAYALLMLCFLPLLCFWRWRRSRLSAIPMNCHIQSVQLVWTWRRVTSGIPPLLSLCGLSLLILAAAQPHDWRSVQLVATESVAIELVVDRSGSMRNDDYQASGEEEQERESEEKDKPMRSVGPHSENTRNDEKQVDEQRVTRLQAVVDAASEFILGSDRTHPQRQDLIGLVSFSKHADRNSNLTLDHERVVAALENLQAAKDYREDGTAIGEGLGLAVAELEELASAVDSLSPGKTLGKVVVLLTDGQNNSGQIGPILAAQLAKQVGVRVYVIGIEPQSVTSSAARERLDSERNELVQIADMTGGKFYSVSDTQGLRKVYREIDQIERIPVAPQVLTVKHQWAVESFELGGIVVPPILLVALVCLLAETILRRTLYLRIPAP